MGAKYKYLDKPGEQYLSLSIEIGAIKDKLLNKYKEKCVICQGAGHRAGWCPVLKSLKTECRRRDELLGLAFDFWRANEVYNSRKKREKEMEEQYNPNVVLGNLKTREDENKEFDALYEKGLEGEKM